ncbi:MULTISPECIES: heavy-metal-associated domain-containing protein [Caproicibacterium]|uniref:Heavy metal-associated domain-containing protein n=1 Tax=Caproicibacterium argilliputei TaxID=3030016 RepID=A0AA97D950_9FIRM|nr:heavy metal-associated domain-containing protein [Caproicibacterium argilliputei]WOC32539.1 heavy metal-associated domain-containing protein [Caproicibacterium argilliputei]
MKKQYRLEDLDCANCAAKMQDAIQKIDGVNRADVNFLSQKLTLEADDARFDEIVKQTVKVCKKVEPDCRILLH